MPIPHMSVPHSMLEVWLEVLPLSPGPESPYLRIRPAGVSDLFAIAQGDGPKPSELPLNGFQDRRLKPRISPSTDLTEGPMGPWHNLTH